MSAVVPVSLVPVEFVSDAADVDESTEEVSVETVDESAVVCVVPVVCESVCEPVSVVPDGVSDVPEVVLLPVVSPAEDVVEPSVLGVEVPVDDDGVDEAIVEGVDVEDVVEVVEFVETDAGVEPLFGAVVEMLFVSSKAFS